MLTETLAETPHALTYWSEMWREAVDKDPAVPMVAPAPVDPQALAQMQAAREAAEKKAGEFKASLQKSINQELQSAEAQADAHMRSAGIDVDAVKARAAKSASFDFLEPARPARRRVGKES